MDNGPSYALHEDVPTQGSEETRKRSSSQSVSVHVNGAMASTPSAYLRKKSSPKTRIMDRADVKFKRSKGRWNIRRDKMPQYWKLYMQDPFHTCVNLRLSKVLLLLTAFYILTLAFFGWLYTTVPMKECRTDIDSFFDGFSFSVSVMFTIGFGTNGGDIFFNGCAWMQTVITVQSLIGVLLDALAIGVIFQRVSRAQSRANTIILSQNACVRRIRGDLYFMFQVCEMRKHQLVEAHVRLYAIRHDVEFGQNYYFQSYPMRIQHPNDELNGMLLLALPSVVVHRIDAWSPLMRPPKREELCAVHHNPAARYLFPEPVARQADLDNGDRDRTVPADVATRQRYCRCTCTGSEGGESTSVPLTHREMMEDLVRYWRESQLEIVVLIEGIDAVTSATIQVRHSYKAEEILFDHRFENCIDVDPETGGAVINFNRFHNTVPVEEECLQVTGAFY